MYENSYSIMEFFLTVGIYVFFAYVWARVGAKFGIGSFVEFLIPIWNLVLLMHCARMSGWHVLWYLVPLANLIISYVVWGRIAWRLGKNVPLYVLLFILVPPVPMLILAFDSSRPVMQQTFVYE